MGEFRGGADGGKSTFLTPSKTESYSTSERVVMLIICSISGLPGRGV